MSTKNATQARTRYPVINNQKECGDCRDVLDVSAFGLQSPKIAKSGEPRYRTNCKKCRSKRTYQSQMEKKISMFPHRYLQCDNEECNFIWAKRRERCPKCGCTGSN